MNKPIKYGLFLLILGVITGGLLAFFNSITAPIIAQNELDALKEQFIIVDTESDDFVDAKLENLPNGIEKVFYGQKDGVNNTVIYWTTTTGYDNGEIKALFVFDLETGKIIDYKVTGAAKQTAGFGLKILDVKLPIVGKYASDYATKSSTEFKKGDPEVISGATMTSKGFINGLIIASQHYVEEFGE